MELQLANPIQHKIADLLWAAETNAEVDKIIRVFGHDARVVYNMMLAATYDQDQSTDVAQQLIKNILDRNRG
jgi:hypothetical protein